jgi:hypothetical protein
VTHFSFFVARCSLSIQLSLPCYLEWQREVDFLFSTFFFQDQFPFWEIWYWKYWSEKPCYLRPPLIRYDLHKSLFCSKGGKSGWVFMIIIFSRDNKSDFIDIHIFDPGSNQGVILIWPNSSTIWDSETLSPITAIFWKKVNFHKGQIIHG